MKSSTCYFGTSGSYGASLYDNPKLAQAFDPWACLCYLHIQDIIAHWIRYTSFLFEFGVKARAILQARGKVVKNETFSPGWKDKPFLTHDSLVYIPYLNVLAFIWIYWPDLIWIYLVCFLDVFGRITRISVSIIFSLHQCHRIIVSVPSMQHQERDNSNKLGCISSLWGSRGICTLYIGWFAFVLCERLWKRS